MIRVLMIPELSRFDKEESGIKRVIEAYMKYVPQHGIRFVDAPIEDEESYDVFAVHAGTTSRYPKYKPIVAHLHGLYWTNDYQAVHWELKANANVITSAKLATIITVPSAWVAETIQRDMRVDPVVLPHGIEHQNWPSADDRGYVLWNKNRNFDVCNPHAVGVLAEKYPGIMFVTTFPPHGKNLSNVREIGVVPHDQMKKILRHATVYLSTTKETFGIGTLEALASGVPVLGFDHGGNKEMVKHGVNGYLAFPNNYEDLAEGLEYCVKFRDVLSVNAKRSAFDFSWEKPAQIVADTYKRAFEVWKADQLPIYL